MPDPHYGRRKDDIMFDRLPPEVVAGLTDSQKVHIEILQNLTSINTILNDLNHDVAMHNKILITGNGEPSLQERVRSISTYIDGIKYWGRFVGGALILQSLAFFAGIVVALIKFLPVLERLANQP